MTDEASDDWAVSYAAGTKVALLATGAALMFAETPTGAMLARCWPLVHARVGVAGIIDALIDSGLDALPGFALICADGAGASVVVRAPGLAVVTHSTGHTQRFDAAGLGTWSEQRLTEVHTVTIGFTTDLVGSATERPGAEAMRSVGGTVLAGSVTVRVARELEPTVPTPGEPDPEPEPAEYSGPEPAEFEADPAPEPPSAAGTTVQAVACPYGHLGPPYEPYCRVCGTAIEDPRPFLAERPPLGLLRLSTGDVIPLDRGVIMGRNPHLPPELDPAQSQSGHPQPAHPPTARPHLIRLPSPDNDVSRTHVEVRLEDWHVLAVDLGSTNGTTVTIPGQPPVRLRALEPMPLEPNAEVNLADEIVFRFEVPTR